MKGPGPYDSICEMVRQITKAKGVVLIILEGGAGDGFSVRSEDPLISVVLPRLLRACADQLEEDDAAAAGEPGPKVH